MAEQEILLEILSQLKVLNARQGSVEEKLNVLDKRQGSVEDKLDILDKRQNSMAEELAAFQEFTVTSFDRMDKEQSKLSRRFTDLENEQRKTNLTIENDIKPALKALAEGHGQMQAQLDRLENKVAHHDEVIFRRVK